MTGTDFENLPILSQDGNVIARAIINHNRGAAIRSALAAAFHISTPDNIQFCAFSDGSHGHKQNRGGVGLVYNELWLPRQWIAGTTDTSCEVKVGKAWSYAYTAGSNVMEAVGVLEALYAANEETKRHLSVLKKHASTVHVKITTDCQAILEYIARTKKVKERQEKAMPPRVFQEIKETIATLQSHGVAMAVEIHWCPRNCVPQLQEADSLAGRAMRGGLGFCDGTWSKATRSVIMEQLVPVIQDSVSFTRIGPATIQAGTTPEKKLRKKDKGKRKAEDEMEEGKPIKKAKEGSAAETQGKRKADDEMEEGKPIKKAKTEEVRPKMPSSWGLSTDTKVNVWDEKEQGFVEVPVERCPFVRETEESTMETGEKILFVNDGERNFCVAHPTALQDSQVQGMHLVGGF